MGLQCLRLRASVSVSLCLVDMASQKASGCNLPQLSSFVALACPLPPASADSLLRRCAREVDAAKLAEVTDPELQEAARGGQHPAALVLTATPWSVRSSDICLWDHVCHLEVSRASKPKSRDMAPALVSYSPCVLSYRVGKRDSCERCPQTKRAPQVRAKHHSGGGSTIQHIGTRQHSRASGQISVFEAPHEKICSIRRCGATHRRRPARAGCRPPWGVSPCASLAS